MNTKAAELTHGQRVVINGESALVESVRASIVGYTIKLNDGRTVVVSGSASLVVI